MKFLKYLPIVLLVACSKTAGEKEQKLPTAKYTADWESLKQHEAAPQWFRDAKFGIYFHWGVYSVPAFGSEWYPRNMHIDGHAAAKHHQEKYGHPSKFGYHDFVPQFTAKHFDAGEWAGLFKKSGARFAGPVAEHHDGFALWDSKVTPWNAKERGPQRDLTGELEKAIKGEGMKFITTFHHARNLQRYTDSYQKELAREVKRKRHLFKNSHYPLFPGMPPLDTTNPELNLLYGNLPEVQWLEKIWLGKLKEVIDNYKPDIVWFDSWLDQIPEEYRRKFSAYYLNEAEKWDKEVVIVRKQMDLPLEFSIDDLERSRKNKIEESFWMTDEAISPSSWCYTENLKIKEGKELIHVLVDITSKNGILLLNISPKADGTIPGDQRKSLLEIGSWLEKYGEAIYGSSPWYTFGEGPTKEPEGNFKNHVAFQKIKYSRQDFRFTKKGKYIYVVQFGKVEAGSKIVLKSFDAGYQVKEVIAMINGEQVEWLQSEDGLTIKAPTKQDDKAPVYKVTLQ